MAFKKYSDDELRDLGFDVEKQKIARKYSKRKKIVSISQTIFFLIFTICVMVFSVSEWLRDFSYDVMDNHWVALLVYASIAIVSMFLVTLPVDYYNEFSIEKDFGLSNYTKGDWFKDQFVSLAVSLVLMLFMLEMFYFLIRVSDLWWLWMWAFYSVFIVFMLFISPFLSGEGFHPPLLSYHPSSILHRQLVGFRQIRASRPFPALHFT